MPPASMTRRSSSSSSSPAAPRRCWPRRGSRRHDHPGGTPTGAALRCARALGEFGATITFAGNLPGRTQTMPLAVYLALETDPASAIVLSVVLLAVSVAVLAV